MKRLQPYYPALIAYTLSSGCVDPYPIPRLDSNAQFLVVDAFLNATAEEMLVKLSRSTAIDTSINFTPEGKATVWLENILETKIPLQEDDNGVYRKQLAAQVGEQFRLGIELQSGARYHSDWVTVKNSPPIDSISYEDTNLGFQVQANTHNSENNSKFYQWEYDETWQYTSAFSSDYEVKDGKIIYRQDQIYNCWMTSASHAILLSSSQSLEGDVISRFPVVTIPKRDIRLFLKYSILVKQRVLDASSFDYWSRMKKNTESLGGLFDPQPSQIFGNLHADSNAQELVLGYFDASTVTEKRFTIGLFELPEGYRFARDFAKCHLTSASNADAHILNPKTYLLITPLPGPSPPAFYYSTVPCSDCRLQGGTTQKPAYW